MRFQIALWLNAISITNILYSMGYNYEFPLTSNVIMQKLPTNKMKKRFTKYLFVNCFINTNKSQFCIYFKWKRHNTCRQSYHVSLRSTSLTELFNVESSFISNERDRTKKTITIIMLIITHFGTNNKI